MFKPEAPRSLYHLPGFDRFIICDYQMIHKELYAVSKKKEWVIVV
jgi:hypothetical protein